MLFRSGMIVLFRVPPGQSNFVATAINHFRMKATATPQQDCAASARYILIYTKMGLSKTQSKDASLRLFQSFLDLFHTGGQGLDGIPHFLLSGERQLSKVSCWVLGVGVQHSRCLLLPPSNFVQLLCEVSQQGLVQVLVLGLLQKV